jgi:hypothetical protein
MSAAVNTVRTRTGRLRPVCLVCNKQGPGMVTGPDGEPTLLDMPRGWSCAPYGADFKHRDGSTGSTFTCPSCNKQLRAGACLQLRNGGTVRRVW